MGSQIVLETGVIRDRNGHPVPDGTPVEFNLRYPTESLVLAPKTETTVAGKARTVVALDRLGELWITVQAGDAKDSTRIELRVGGDTPGTIATVVPTPTPLPTPTPTLTPLPTATAVPTPSPTAAPDPASVAPRPPGRVWRCRRSVRDGRARCWRRRGLVCRPAAQRERPARRVDALIPGLAAALWAIVVAWIAYLLYALGWLPGRHQLQMTGSNVGAGLVTFAAGALRCSGRESRQSGMLSKSGTGRQASLQAA